MSQLPANDPVEHPVVAEEPQSATKKSHHSHYDDYDENGTRPNGQLSTSSPAGIAAAAAVTPDKLANLLLTEGPLAIRHLTSHLARIIPGFSNLSLSKQRRLIIAALDSGDPVTGCVFEKVGWGQWAARHVGSEFVKQRQAEINKAQNSSTNENNNPQDAVMTNNEENNSSPSNNADLHSSKSLSPSMVRKPSESYGWKNRRDSISKQLATSAHGVTNPPRSPRVSFRSNKVERISTTTVDEDVEDAIFSSSDDDDDEDDDDNSNNISRNSILHRNGLPSSAGNINSVGSYTSYPTSITSPVLSPGATGSNLLVGSNNALTNASTGYHVGKPYRRRYSSNSRRSSTTNKFVGTTANTTNIGVGSTSSSTTSLPLTQQHSANHPIELMDTSLNNRFQFHDRQRSHSSIVPSSSSSSTSPPTKTENGNSSATTVHNIVASPTVASSSISTATSRRQSRSSFGTSDSSPPFFGTNGKLGGFTIGNSLNNNNDYANSNIVHARLSVGSSGSGRIRSRLSSFNAEDNNNSPAHGGSTGSGSSAIMDELQTFRQSTRRQSFNESFIRGGSSGSINIGNGSNKKPNPVTSPKRINISSLTNPAPPSASSSTLKVVDKEAGESGYHSDTDEEDWQSMGPMGSAKANGEADKKFDVKKPLQVREETAAMALMNLSAH